MADINAVLAQLKANKKRAHNHAGATRRIKRTKKNTHKDLGKLQGYCDTCGLMIAEKDYENVDGIPTCPKCGGYIEHLSRHKPENKIRRDAWGNSSIPAGFYEKYTGRMYA